MLSYKTRDTCLSGVKNYFTISCFERPVKLIKKLNISNSQNNRIGTQISFKLNQFT